MSGDDVGRGELVGPVLSELSGERLARDGAVFETGLDAGAAGGG